MKDLPVCIFCGLPTDKYWFLDNKNNFCRCIACCNNGIAQTEQEKDKYFYFLSMIVENGYAIRKQHSPTSSTYTTKSDLSIWQLHITEGSERLRRWANESAKKRGYL